MKKNRFAALVCAMLMTYCFVACQGKTDGPFEELPEKNPGTEAGGVITGDPVLLPKDIPDFSEFEDSRFDIWSWGAPKNTTQQLGYYKEAGFNTQFLFAFEENSVSKDYDENYEKCDHSLSNTQCKHQLSQTMKAAEEYGLNGCISLSNGWQQRGNGLQLGGTVNQSYWYDSMLVFYEQGIDYTQFSSFIGIMAYDEPGGEGTYGGNGIFKDYDWLLGNVDTNEDGFTDTYLVDLSGYSVSDPSLRNEWINDQYGKDRLDGLVKFDSSTYVLSAPSQFEMFKGLWGESIFSQLNERAVFHNGSFKDYRFNINLHGAADSEPDHAPDQRLYPTICGQGGKISAMVDYYVLEYNAQKDMPVIRAQVLQKYEYFALQAKKYNMPFETFILTGQQNVVEGTARGDNADGFWSESEIYWQTYTGMSFGATGVLYFTYYLSTTESGSGQYIGVIDNVGQNKTKAFDYVKNANENIQKFAPALKQFRWLGVMTNIGTRNAQGYNQEFDNIKESKITEHYLIRSFTSSRDTLIGCFEGKGEYEEYDAFTLMNFEDPYFKRTDVVQVGFNGASKALLIGRTKENLSDPDSNAYVFQTRVVDLEEGTLTVDIDYGDMLIVIPIA